MDQDITTSHTTELDYLRLLNLVGTLHHTIRRRRSREIALTHGLEISPCQRQTPHRS